MKTLFIATFLIVFFVSCGNKNYNAPTKIIEVEKEVEIEVEKEVEIEIFRPQDFEGIYYFDNGGYLELIAGIDDEVTIMREGQSLTSINPKNDTFASHPAIYKTGLEPVDNKLRFTTNVNYTDGYDLEEDESGKDIRDSRRTDYEIKLLKNGNIKLTIKIYSDRMNHNANYIVAERTFTSL